MQSKPDLSTECQRESLHLHFAASNNILMGRSAEAGRDSRAQRGVTRDTVPARTEFQRTNTSDGRNI